MRTWPSTHPGIHFKTLFVFLITCHDVTFLLGPFKANSLQSRSENEERKVGERIKDQKLIKKSSQQKENPRCRGMPSRIYVVLKYFFLIHGSEPLNRRGAVLFFGPGENFGRFPLSQVASRQKSGVNR